MIVRVRTRVGTWRQEAQPTSKLSEFLANLEHERNIKVLQASLKPNYSSPFSSSDGSKSLQDLGIRHGDMLHVDATASSSSASSASHAANGLVGSGPKVVDSHGNLVAAEKVVAKNAFRPGLHALRSQKLHWTLTDMVEFDKKYTFEVKGEQKSFCSSASLDAESLNNFQLYLRKFAFQTCRCAFLYGKFLDGDMIPGSVEERARLDKGSGIQHALDPSKKKVELSDLEKLVKVEEKPSQGVMVHAVYEPLQENSPDGFELLEDPREEKVERIAQALGLQRVGVLISHPPREGYHFSTHEIINCGEQALEATNGKFDSPFVVVKVTSEDGNASFDTFSLTPQCLEMVAEDALLHMPDNPGHAAVNETFTLIVEKKEAHVVDNDFFIKRVPILSHTSPYSGNFPRLNRDHDTPPNAQSLKAILAPLGNSPSDASIAKALSDFHALVYVTEIFDSMHEIEEIARFVASHVIPDGAKLPLAEGYKVILLGAAGLAM